MAVGSLKKKKKGSPIYLRENKPKQNSQTQNFLLCLYYHLVQVSEDSAVRLCICVPPHNIGTLPTVALISGTAVSTSSVKTHENPAVIANC